MKFDQTLTAEKEKESLDSKKLKLLLLGRTGLHDHHGRHEGREQVERPDEEYAVHAGVGVYHVDRGRPELHRHLLLLLEVREELLDIVRRVAAECLAAYLHRRDL